MGFEEFWPGTGAEDQNYHFSVCQSLTLDVRRNGFNMRNVFESKNIPEDIYIYIEEDTHQESGRVMGKGTGIL